MGGGGGGAEGERHNIIYFMTGMGGSLLFIE